MEDCYGCDLFIVGDGNNDRHCFWRLFASREY